MKSPEPRIPLTIDDVSPLRTLLQGVRVLVVEPDVEYCLDVTAALRARGAAVVTAGSLAEALKALAMFGPDVLAVDIELPISELDVLRERVLRLAFRRGRPIPAVAMTPAAMLQARERAREGGFQLQVSRPVDPARLAAAIARLVPHARPLDGHAAPAVQS